MEVDRAQCFSHPRLKGEVTAVHPKFRDFGPDSGGRYSAHKWSQIDFLSKYMIFEIF